MLEPGKLNRRITIQKPILVKDGLGGIVTEGWQDFAKTWAYILNLNGKEFSTKGIDTTTTTTSIRIRYREGITTQMRVLFRDQPYNITAVLPDDAGREYIDLACELGANDG